jgi:hypothetical protein
MLPGRRHIPINPRASEVSALMKQLKIDIINEKFNTVHKKTAKKMRKPQINKDTA